MIYKNLIPEIDKKIANTLKKLKLKPKVSPKEFIKKTKGKKHRYSSICYTSEGRKIIFYARLKKNIDAKQKVIREIYFFNKIKSKKLKIKEYLPKFYQGKIGKDFEWFAREYIKFPPLGTNELLKREIKEKDVKILAKAIKEISQTALEKLKGVPLKKLPVKSHLVAKNFFPFLIRKRIISENETQRILKILKRSYFLLKEENKYFSHGDFNLGNLLIFNGNLKIIDWESIRISSFASDPAYLYMHLWRVSKKIRRKLIEDYLSLLSKKKRVVFKRIFPVIVFYLAIEGIEAKPSEIKRKKLLEKREKFFKRIIKNFSFGFENLVL